MDPLDHLGQILIHITVVEHFPFKVHEDLTLTDMKHNFNWNSKVQSTSLPIAYPNGREGIITYEYTLSSIQHLQKEQQKKKFILVDLLPIHLKWPQIDLFKIFKANSSVKSTKNVTSKFRTT